MQQSKHIALQPSRTKEEQSVAGIEQRSTQPDQKNHFSR
jgi:hypothetical protein